MPPMMYEKKLTYEELTDACDEFFPIFSLIKSRLPKNSSAEDVLVVMEAVMIIAYKNRVRPINTVPQRLKVKK